MRRAIVALALVTVACGGGEVTMTTEVTSTTSAAPGSVEVETTVTTATTTTAPAPVPPAVLSLSSGRGDDGSFEATVWFGSDPTAAADYRIVVGADVDLGYPGVGDPFSFLEGHLELTPDGAALMMGDTVVAEGAAINDLVSWGFTENVLRVYFIDTTPARGGTTWVIVEQDGERVPFGTAGAPFGSACSYHSAGTGVDASGIPDAGTPCRYP